MKPIVWMGSSRRDLKSFPEEVQDRVGFELFLLQSGEEPTQANLSLLQKARLYDGQEYRNTYLFLLEFDAQDRIRHVREYFDPDPVRQILQPAVELWRQRQAGKG